MLGHETADQAALLAVLCLFTVCVLTGASIWAAVFLGGLAGLQVIAVVGEMTTVWRK
ncbi:MULTISPECIES: hypothetical protein [unclassified Williamsia]|uniref:hypothetical protein n=1 Tax=unclassified Williamsia TaxID=2636252 RepID=UPI00143C6EFA|nr:MULTISPECIES: hypothetical protein [unclassified Williamsia]